jgi:hypothetical protein
VKYNELIQFEPIESVIQIRDVKDPDYALKLVDTYVISERMAEAISETIIEQLQFDHFADNKGLLIVGNYGTGKSHLMSVISTIAEFEGVSNRVKNEKVAQKARMIEGKFKVIRIEIGAVTMPLRDIICGALENNLAEMGVAYKFPPMDQVRSNKDALTAMMGKFHEVFPDKGLLLVVDELLDYLRGRKDQEVILDLGFLREIGEFCRNSRFRFIAGVQEMLFDNPKFQFVAQQLRRVKERFEQVLIVREDIAYVVSQRLLKKTARQKALIREHLSKFTPLYEKLGELMDEFVELFPVHPAYLSTFEKVTVAEKRVVLTTLSHEMKKLLDQEVPADQPGIISFDSYWPYIEEEPGLRTDPDIREVMSKVKVLKDRIQNAMTKPQYQPMALRIVHALAVHRLTIGDIYSPLGMTAEELRDSLFLHISLPEEDSEFLRSTIEVVLKEILITVSWQYISFNEENGQYYLDLKKDIPVDDLINQKAENLDGNTLDRYYFNALSQVLEKALNNTYVANYRIWAHELPWWKANVTRAGYLFFGAPNERSTAQPPRDFYLYFLQPYDPPKFKNENKPDEVFFQLKRRDETFDRYLALYAGAEELSMVAAAGTKKLYEDKAREYLRLVNKWLRENIQEAFEVIYQGTGKPVKEWITGLPPQASTTEIVDHVAANCLAGWFDQKYPDYPHFIRLRTPMTRENLTSYVQDALQSIAGEPTRNGLAILHGLVLMEDEKLNVRNSGYAKWILNKLEEKGKGQVVNRSELITTLYTCHGTEDLEQTQEFAMEPELLVVLLAALVYNGDIVITINGNSYDAMKFDRLIKLPINELKAFSHIKRPSGLPLPELKALFDFLGIAPGLLQERALEEGVRELNRKTNHLLSQTLSVLQIVRSQIPTWEEPLLTENERDTYEKILLKFQEFLEKILIFNTPAKLHNFRYSLAEIEEQQQAKDLLKKITDLQQRAQEVAPFATYLKIAQPQLPDSHPWQQQATAALDVLWQALRRGEPCQNEKAAVLRLKTEYQELYLALHAKARLNASEESKVQDLLASQEMTALKQLATIDLVPTRQLEQLLEELSELKACWQLAKANLDNQPLCPYCKFRPKDEQITKENIGDYEDRVQDLLEQWTTMLMTNLNDPEVKKSIELLGEEGQKLINEFFQNQAFVLPINVRLLQAIKESLQGIERVEIPLTALISALGGGAPLTIEEARQRFEKMLASHIGTQATQRIRIMLKLPSGEE